MGAKYFKNSDQVLAFLENLPEIKSFRKKLGIPEQGFNGLNEYIRWQRKYRTKLPKIMVRITQLLNKIMVPNRVPSYYQKFVELNILFSEVPEEVAVVPKKVVPETKFNPDTQRDELWVQIHGDTELKDLKAVWRDIAWQKKKLYDYKSKTSEILDDVFHLKQSGYSYKQIKSKVKKQGYTFKSDQDLAKNLSRRKKLGQK